jgi:hypothetical protein
MNYRVLWAPNAEQRLEDLLQDAAAQAQIAGAAREIDRRLLTAPLLFGESRFEAVRIGFAHPLAVHFEVLDDVRTVVVYDVYRIDLKRS